MAKKPNQQIELEPDAWSRFEQFIRNIAKAGPQHRTPANLQTKRKNRNHKQPRKWRALDDYSVAVPSKPYADNSSHCRNNGGYRSRLCGVFCAPSNTHLF